MKSSRKKTIFRLFLIPLTVVMLIQGAITLGSLILSRASKALKDYSVGMMNRTVENRKVILQNEMIQRWSSINEESAEFQDVISGMLEEQGIDMEGFLESEELQNAFLEEIAPECLESLRNNTATGLFVTMANQEVPLGDSVCSGIYLRDADPHASPANFSDLLMERGSKQISREMNIPLDTCWTAEFHLEREGSREEDAFFYKPYMAGKDNPDVEVKNLGYWSMPFSLEDKGSGAAYKMLTYSIPLIYNHTVYGVMGVEISCDYLREFFPLEELQENRQAGYMLAVDQGDGSWLPVTGNGVFYERIMEEGGTFKVSETDYDSFYRIDGHVLPSQTLYTLSRPLKIYNDNTPFSGSRWIIAGINTREQLFGIGNQMYARMVAAICAGLLFGIICIYFLIRHLTKPIKRLMECIGSSKEGGLEKFKRSDIVEVDGLYDVVKDLTCRQKEAEEALIEEKERYRLALESSKDTFFTYDLKTKDLDIFNTSFMQGRWKCAEHPGMIGVFMEKEIFPGDKEKVRQAFRKMPQAMKFEMRLKTQGWKDYRWIMFNGKVIPDSSGSPSKLVGSLQSINEKKLRELKLQEQAVIDPVTSLFTRRGGTEKMEEMRREVPEGIMVLVDLDRFREMDERYGIVFGDAILEELGRVIRGLCRDEVQKGRREALPFRFGGDELLMWLPKYSREEGQEFLDELYWRVSHIFGGSDFHIGMTSGAVCAKAGDTTESLEGKAVCAQKQAKAGARGRCQFYESTKDGKEQQPDILGSQIVSLGYADHLNMVSLTLNFFDKGGDIDTVMTVLLMKLGRYYGASDILVSMVNTDFRTSYLEYQWHDRPGSWVNSHMLHYTADELEQFISWNKEGYHHFGIQSACSSMLCKFLMVQPSQRGVVISMADNGNYVGSISFVGNNDALLMREEERKNLREIGTIIQNSLNRERHDLASQAKSEFLSRMSHEIRTPMNGIIGMTEIALQNKEKPERVMDCLQKIRHSSDYLLGLINDILDMSKIESGKMQLEFGNFNLSEMLENIRELMEPQARAKNVSYVQDVSLKNAWFYGDKLRISQVLINLIGNAVKFTGDQGEIRLKVTQSEGNGNMAGLYFEVKDNGAGISAEDQERVFHSFEQAEGSGMSRTGGTGLGLAISSRLVQLMDGEIKLESRLGKGSRFYFKIHMPLGEVTAEAKNLPEKTVAYRGRRVLLVEDNELNAEIAKVLLENYQFTVDWADNGRKAVECVRSTAPGTYDLIMMDIRMPVMDGLEATKAIRGMDRADAASIPIVAMTANAFDEDMKKSIECGMNGHLAKPVDVRRLQEILRQLFGE